MNVALRLTEPLSAEIDADECRWNGEVVDEGMYVEPELQLVRGGDALKPRVRMSINTS